MSHAQHTTAVKLNVTVTELRRLLITNKGRSAFPRAKKFQTQLHTPQSISLVPESDDAQQLVILKKKTQQWPHKILLSIVWTKGNSDPEILKGCNRPF